MLTRANNLHYIECVTIIALSKQFSGDIKLKTNTMQNNQKDYSILLMLIILLSAIAVSSKPVTFRDCNKVTAPLRCKFIKTNGKQCLNASYKCDTVCKYHKTIK